MKWAWSFEDEERAHGPFSSREDALSDAREVCESYTDQGTADSYRIYLGMCIYPDPGGYLDLDWIGEVLEERAADDGGFDDKIFTLAKGLECEAQRELSEWARRWFETKAWYMVDGERVIVSVDPRNSPNNGEGPQIGGTEGDRVRGRSGDIRGGEAETGGRVHSAPVRDVGGLLK